MRCYVLHAGHMIPIAFLRSYPLKLHENGDGVNMKQITGRYAFCQTKKAGINGFFVQQLECDDQNGSVTL
jgi:hypothetical protein